MAVAQPITSPIFLRRIRVYGASAAMMPKLFLAYQFRIWFSTILEIVGLIITVAFWRAVYSGQDTIAGLTAEQTISYILMARIFHDGMYVTNMLREFGDLLREGGIQIVLLRPLDFQGSLYLQKLALLGLNLMMRFPLAFVAWLLFGLRLPTDPVVWAAATMTLLLGVAVMFCFDWILASAAFYITDAWGLATARQGVAMFFSGMLIPLAIMPDWLRDVALILPFSQAVYLPVSVLSGLTPVVELTRIWLMQLLYLAVLVVLSRLAFSRAVRVITVQGG